MIKKIVRKIISKTKGENIKIGNHIIRLSRNHNLPSVLEKYPDYGSNLVRLAGVIYSKYKPLSIFDIGGNVGDTVAMLLQSGNQYTIFTIEGDEKYAKILRGNFKSNSQVHVYTIFLGEKNETINTLVNRNEGTLRINPANEAESSTIIVTLDSFIENHKECGDVKLLKIDTDGFDNRILRGAKKYLTNTKPVIYFEYDQKLLQDNGEIGVDIFQILREIGYSTIVFFDNYGRMLISSTLDNTDILKQLNRYISDRKGAFPYYDIMVFHSEDNDIAQNFIEKEGSLA